MLTFLTGHVQTGKTRWLTQHVGALAADGVSACGVISPGTWIDRGQAAKGDKFEKIGIQAVLLPSHETIPFARRNDLVGPTSSPNSRQSTKAGLGWTIDDAAIDRINAHFAELATVTQPARRLLVIDELGVLEIERNEGFVEAVALLDRGATPAFPDALAVVRESLLDRAIARFSPAPWHGIETLRLH